MTPNIVMEIKSLTDARNLCRDMQQQEHSADAWHKWSRIINRLDAIRDAMIDVALAEGIDVPEALMMHYQRIQSYTDAYSNPEQRFYSLRYSH